jgi:hypothetical protein
MLTAEHALQLHLINQCAKLFNAPGNLMLRILVTLLNSHLQEHVGVFQFVEIPFPGLYDLQQLAQFLLDLLGMGLVIPEILGQDKLLQTLCFQLFAGEVKDAPSGRASGP